MVLTKNICSLVFFFFCMFIQGAVTQCEGTPGGWFSEWASYKVQCKILSEDINEANNPGKVPDIKARCKGNAMLISWSPAKNLDTLKYYAVSITKKNGNDGFCACFNTGKSLSFLFNTTYSFKQDQDYQVTVNASPRRILDDPYIDIGACPRKGASNWTSYGPCKCHQAYIYKDYCEGERTSYHQCTLKTNRSLVISNAYCDTENHKVESCTHRLTPSPPPPVVGTAIKKTKVENPTIAVFIVGSLAFICMAAMSTIIFYLKKKYHAKRPPPQPPCRNDNHVYISHLTSSAGNNNSNTIEQREEKLLLFVQSLHEYGIHCIVDLLNSVGISEAGGLPQWIPDQIKKCQKIVIIITKQYLQALSSISNDNKTESTKNINNNNSRDETHRHNFNDTEMVRKIHWEISHIKSKAFESYQKGVQILLVLQGVHLDDIPLDLFCFRSCVSFPTKYDESDEDFRKILGILCNIEPVQIA